MWQEIFWLGVATSLGKTIALSRHMPPGFQALWHLMNESLPHCDHPTFRNGVELWCWAHGSVLALEELRSSERGGGHASRVMQFVVAAADVSGADLIGAVEAHPYDDRTDSLTDDQLYAWYESLGFRREGPLENSIIRDPIQAPQNELDRALKSAQQALSKKVAQGRR